VGEYVEPLEVVPCAEALELGVVGVSDRGDADVPAGKDRACSPTVDGTSGIDVVPKGVHKT
jgi:hypothetical protein